MEWPMISWLLVKNNELHLAAFFVTCLHQHIYEEILVVWE